MKESDFLKNFAKAFGAEDAFQQLEEKKLKEKRMLESLGARFGVNLEKEEEKEVPVTLIQQPTPVVIIEDDRPVEEEIVPEPEVEPEVIEENVIPPMPELPVDTIVTKSVEKIAKAAPKDVQKVVDEIPGAMRRELDAVKKSITDLHRFSQRHSQMGGGGEVRLLRLDDVNASTVADGYYLRYDEATRMLVFDVPAGGNGGISQVQSDWTEANVLSKAYIKNKPTVLDGANGVGITNTSINGSGNLVITYSNTTVVDVGHVVGATGAAGANGANGTNGSNGSNGTDGANGISVSSAVVNGNGSLIITYSNTFVANAGYVVGATGATGANGANGATGATGATGANGISITNTSINIDGSLEVTYSNTFVANAGHVIPTYNVSIGSSVAGGNLSLTGNTFTFNPATEYSLPIASTSTLGGVKVDNVTITIAANGVIKANYPTTLAALDDVLTGSPSNNQVLTFSTTLNKWIPTTIAGTGNTATGVAYYGNYSDNFTQTTTANTATPVKLRTVFGQNGFVVQSNTQVKALYSGVYNIQFSAQLHNTGGGGSGTRVSFWLRVNGTNVTDSMGQVDVQTNNPYMITSWNIITELNSNDYFELVWETENAKIVLDTVIGYDSAPDSPSMILTVVPVTGVIAPSTVSSLTVTGTASAVNFINQTQTIVSNGGITALTANSAHFVYVNGTSTHRVILPDATTLTSGQNYVFNNNSTANVAVADGANGTIISMPPGAAIDFIVTGISSQAGSWDTHSYIPASATWGTSNLVFANGTINTGIVVANLTGTASQANNSAYLGSVAANQYAYANSLSSYQTTAGLSANVATLSSNNASYLGTKAANQYAYANGTNFSLNTNVAISYAPATTVGQALTITAANTVGGTSYADVLKFINGSAGVSNPNKSIRLNNIGTLELLNSAYTGVLLSVSDAGVMALGGAGTSNNDPTSNYIGLNGNLVLYDDGNPHIHSRANAASLWINTNNGAIILGNQAVGTGTSVASGIIMGSGSTTVKGYTSIYGSKSYAVSGYGYLATSGAGSIGGSSGTVPYSLYCSDRIQASEVDATSDERAKNIQGTIPLDQALKFVREVDGIHYTWDLDAVEHDDGGLKAGFGAQAVHKAGFDHMIGVIPNEKMKEQVDDDGWVHPEGMQLTMGYNQAIPYHHQVIKHLLDKVEKLEALVAKLTEGNK